MRRLWSTRFVPWSSEFHPEKVIEHRGIDLPLHLRQPAHLKRRRCDPAKRLKFRVLRLDADVRVVAREVAKKVELLLSVEALFDPPAAVEIAVRPAARDDAIILRRHTDLLPQLARQRPLGRLVVIDSALWELPRAGHAQPLADQNPARGVAQNARG